jgi:hypothetical protein
MGLGMFRILGSQVFFHPDFVQNKLLSRIRKTIQLNKIMLQILNKHFQLNSPTPNIAPALPCAASTAEAEAAGCCGVICRREGAEWSLGLG